jgi:hypothetical protein
VRSYTTKLERVFENFLRFQLANTFPTYFHSFKTTTKCPFYSPSSYHLLIIIFLFKKLVGISILKISIKNYVRGKREPPMIRICLLKRKKKEVKQDPKLDGQRIVPMFGGQWKEKEKKRVFFHLFPFPPQTTLLRPLFFFLQH